MQNASSMYSMWRCTPVYNLTHVAPQDNFSLMPNCSLGPPDSLNMKQEMFSKINSFGLCQNAWLPWQPILRFLQMCVCVGGGGGGWGGAVHTNSIIS